MRNRSLVALTCALSLFVAPALAAAQSSVPPGTRATLALRGWLSSGDANVGDTFEATLVNEINVEGRVAVPAGAIFTGRVAAVERKGKGGKGGELTLVIDKLVSGDGRSATSHGTITGIEDGDDLKGDGDKGKKAGIGAAVGGVLGAIVGGTSGLVVGAVLGAGGGIAAGSGKDVHLPEGTRLLVKFDQSVEVTWGWMPQSHD